MLAAERTNSSPLWLDMLPLDICENVAAHVTLRNLGSDATNLAMTSRPQCRAVWGTVSALSVVHFDHPCYPDFATSEEHAQRDQYIAEQTLSFPGHDHCQDMHLTFVDLSPAVSDILHTFNITKCTLWCRFFDAFTRRCYDMRKPERTTTIFDEVVSKSSIRILNLEITEDADTQAVFTQLSKMNLEQLILYGCLTGDRLDQLATACSHISTECPTLHLISISKIYIQDLNLHVLPPQPGAEQVHDRTYWKAVRKLPLCCEVAIHKVPPDNLVERLRQFRGLEVSFLSPRQVERLEPSVILYRNNKDYALRSSDLNPLKILSNLRVLELTLVPGAVRKLPEVLRCCQAIQRLCVMQEEREGGPEGILLEIVREGPQLEDLEVSRILFSSREWKDSLEKLGSRLRKLTVRTGMDSGKEAAPSWGFDEEVERLEVILLSILRYNRGLKHLDYEPIRCPSYYKRDMYRQAISSKQFVSDLCERIQDAMPGMEFASLHNDGESLIYTWFDVASEEEEFDSSWTVPPFAWYGITE